MLNEFTQLVDVFTPAYKADTNIKNGIKWMKMVIIKIEKASMKAYNVPELSKVKTIKLTL
jgi:hypothetical protein